MRFVSFFGEREKSVTYSYHRRGVGKGYHPDLQREENDLTFTI